MNLLKFLIGFFCLLILPNIASAQTEQNDSSERQLVVVVSKDGSERTGYILKDDGREILLETKTLGKIFILKSTIVSITPVKDGVLVRQAIQDPLYLNTGPFTTRYAFTTNSLPIKKGENYSIINLYGPEVHFAVSDRLSLGIMTTWIASPFILAVKYSIPTKNEKINFGLGTLLGTSAFLNSFRGFGGLHWGMVTFGDRLNNMTFSLGYSYAKPGASTEVNQIGRYKVDNSQGLPVYPIIPTKTVSNLTTAPVIGIGGIFKVGDKASIILDGMLFIGRQNSKQNITKTIVVNGKPDYMEVTEAKKERTGLFYLMPGMRFQKSANSAFQVSLAGVTLFWANGDRASFPVPMCSWLRKF